MTHRDDDWLLAAACRGMDSAAFYVNHKTVPEDLRLLCGGCPVAGECLDDALATPGCDDYGIWSATTRQERRQLRAARQRTAS